MEFSQNLKDNITHLHEKLNVQTNFDVVYRIVHIGGREACLYFIDGFTKDESLLKILQVFSTIKPEDMPKDAHAFSKQYVPYGEIGLLSNDTDMITQLLSGVSCLFIDGFDKCITIDCRTYPSRGVSEPEKDKVMRGSRDGFVETLIFNTALIRRRIRDPRLTMEIMSAGESSHTDIAICYMENRVDKQLLKILKKELSISSEDIFQISGPLDLTFLMKMYGLDGFDHLKTPKYTPQPVPELMNEDNIFTNIRKGDILLHHPYQSFDPVVNFVRSAARDPEVLAIKQTLYRVSGNSPIIAALAEAADNGKQVSVLVELKARFDEENNINWAKMLEKAGCHVIYGLVGLKTHSKITLVVRMEEDGIRRYVHLGTGNYNDSTAKLYTDCGILTCDPQIGEDATAVFNMLSGYAEPLAWNKLSVAPLWLRGRFLRMIRREAEHARNGKPAHIMAKMNSLCDKEIITALYEASCAGVKIEMIIRGICCLKAGVPGLSENISVRSIVGNFLEHSRIFYFLNDASPEVYMGSADWMPRNLDRRVEIMFPVENQKLKEQVIRILKVELEDNVKAHILQPDGTYEKEDKRGKVLVNSQEQFCREAVMMAKEFRVDDLSGARVFTPIESGGGE